jgi:hypothetical protein
LNTKYFAFQQEREAKAGHIQKLALSQRMHKKVGTRTRSKIFGIRQPQLKSFAFNSLNQIFCISALEIENRLDFIGQVRLVYARPLTGHLDPDSSLDNADLDLDSLSSPRF